MQENQLPQRILLESDTKSRTDDERTMERWSNRMNVLNLLRKKDLPDKVGAPKSTIADWIEDFRVYMPIVKQGNATYYKSEIIDVLIFIKDCREQNYQKPQIMQLLADKGFPITVEDAVEDVKRALDTTNYRDHLLTVMQTMGQAVTKIAEQDETLVNLKNKQDGQDERLNRLDERTDEIDVLKKEIEELKREIAATKEEKSKGGFFNRFFGK